MRTTKSRIKKLEKPTRREIGIRMENSDLVKVGDDMMTPDEFAARYPGGVILLIKRVEYKPDAM